MANTATPLCKDVEPLPHTVERERMRARRAGVECTLRVPERSRSRCRGRRGTRRRSLIAMSPRDRSRSPAPTCRPIDKEARPTHHGKGPYGTTCGVISRSRALCDALDVTSASYRSPSRRLNTGQASCGAGAARAPETSKMPRRRFFMTLFRAREFFQRGGRGARSEPLRRADREGVYFWRVPNAAARGAFAEARCPQRRRIVKDARAPLPFLSYAGATERRRPGGCLPGHRCVLRRRCVVGVCAAIVRPVG